MKIPYFCCIGAELKRYAKDFDFMNQVYLYKIPAEDTIEEVFAQDYFEAISDTVLQDDIVYIYEPTSKTYYTCRFNKQNGHIIAEQMTNNVPALTPDKILISDENGEITTGDVSLDYIKNQLLAKVNIDGSSIMTGPLKIRAGSMQGAIAPYWDGIGLFKLNSDDSVTLLASMEATDGLCPATNNTYNIGKTNYKWKDAYIARVITAVLNNGADINVPTVAGTLARVEDIENKMTNCITEIPQDIKLELSSGTLTLKAGSKVYVPNGAGVFDIVNITDDRSITETNDGEYLVAANLSASITARLISNCVSGAGATTTSGFAYNTTTNIINNYSSSGTVGAQQSFPIAVITVSGGAISSIDQVFNGFGYVGSTVFALPNVKGLISNGRNADGSLNNIEFSVSSVLTATDSSTSTNVLTLNSSGIARITATNYFYDSKNNIVINKYNNTQVLYTLYGFNKTQNGVVSDFSTKTTFHAVDYSDTEYIAHQAMPSDRHVDLTLPSTGGTLTMPADGYLTVAKQAAGNNEYLTITNNTNKVATAAYMPNGYNGRVYMPVSKGDVITITYTASGTTQYCRFVYANGAK